MGAICRTALILAAFCAGAGCGEGGEPRPDRPTWKPVPDVGGVQPWETGSGRGDRPIPSTDAPPSNPKKVRVVYLVPTDRPSNSTYLVALEKAAQHVQRWYRDQMPGKATFTLPSPVCATKRTTHAASWYSTYVPSGATSPSFMDNVISDGSAAYGAKTSDPDNFWLIYIDADPACGQPTGSFTGLAVFPANDLRGLVGQTLTKVCPTDPTVSVTPCRWAGGLAHLAGRSFGLPSPAGCDENLPTCDKTAIMSSGFYDYPSTHLTADDKALLAKSPFFAASPTTAPLGSCSPL